MHERDVRLHDVSIDGQLRHFRLVFHSDNKSVNHGNEHVEIGKITLAVQIYNNYKLCKAIFFIPHNILPANFAILLLHALCSFQLW